MFKSILAMAAVPLSWMATPERPQPVQFDRYHGETLEFRCTFTGFGALPFAGDGDVRLWYQTNGMGAAWWSVPATVSSNMLAATFPPGADPGAERLSVFFGAPSNAYAAAQVRFRNSPGATPNDLAPPSVLDWQAELAAATNEVLQAALASDLTTNDVRAIAATVSPPANLTPATNYTDSAVAALSNAVPGMVAGVVTNETAVYTTNDTWICNNPTGEGWIPIWNGTVWVMDIISVVLPPDATTYTLADEMSPEPGQGDFIYTRIPSSTRNALGLARLSDIPAPVSLAQATNYTDTAVGALRDGLVNGGITVMDSMRAVSLDGTEETRSADTVFSQLDNAATKSELQTVSNEAQVVYRLFSGSNVVMEVTNYNSQVNAPEMKLLQLNESNEYFTVWTETNGLKRTLNTATAQAAQLVSNERLRAEAAYAPRAWSRTTSGMGVEAPEGVTWLSTPVTVIAGGYEYEKHVTSGGAIWLLTSRGATFDINPATNNTAYLNIAASDGTPIFRIEKTDSYLIGVNANAVETDGNVLVVGMDLISTSHPFVRVCTNLVNAVWYEEDENGFPRPDISTITWTQRTGGWTCRISNNTGSSSLFARFEFLQEGGVKVINTGATDLSGGIVVNGVHYSTLGTTTVNGKTVLTLEN